MRNMVKVGDGDCNLPNMNMATGRLITFSGHDVVSRFLVSPLQTSLSLLLQNRRRLSLIYSLSSSVKIHTLDPSVNLSIISWQLTLGFLFNLFLGREKHLHPLITIFLKVYMMKLRLGRVALLFCVMLMYGISRSASVPSKDTLLGVAPEGGSMFLLLKS